ncbi:MAG: hypothetical protein QXI61_06580, partial [Nitrososphaerota archaeon]
MTERRMYFLTDEDLAKLRQLGMELESIRHDPISSSGNIEQYVSAEHYVARLPEDEVIAPLSGCSPGRNDNCCVFRIKHSVTGERKVELITRDDGTPYRITVFNIYDSSMTNSHGLFRVLRLKTGGWLCEKPWQLQSVTTTTGYSTTTGSGGRTDFPCAGICKWRWNGTTNQWELDTDTCNTTTTTTTGLSETTTTPCGFCPKPTTTTSGTTTSTTSTTSAICRCAIPTCCGTRDGDIAVSYCTDRNDPAPPNCGAYTTTTTTTTGTTTTTPSCNCNTTTTQPGIGIGCGQCVVTYNDAGQVISIFDRCNPGCFCSYPPSGSCGHSVFSCVQVPPPPPPGPPPECRGSCDFLCIDHVPYLLARNCSTLIGCDCLASPCTQSGCYRLSVPCSYHTTTTSQSTTTTCNPSDCYCYCRTSTTSGTTTSTTTTTTTAPCKESCTVRWDGSQWLLYTGCESGCSCDLSSPGPAGNVVGEIRCLPCARRTTTTT